MRKAAIFGFTLATTSNEFSFSLFSASIFLASACEFILIFGLYIKIKLPFAVHYFCFSFLWAMRSAIHRRLLFCSYFFANFIMGTWAPAVH